MKKQLFLLSLLSLLFVSTVSIVADSSCCTPTCCTPVCCNTNDNCNPCVLTHGKTYLRTDNEFQNGAPVFVSNFSSNILRYLDEDDKHGNFQVVVFGGKNTKQSNAAAYFFPYGHTSYTVDGEVSPMTHASVLAMTAAVVDATAVSGNSIQIAGRQGGDAAPNTNVYTSRPAGGAAYSDGTDVIATDAATFKFDANKDTSIIRPWNFGITYAALFEPVGSDANGEYTGTGLVSSPVFKSTICPRYEYSHVGAGFALNYQFSEDRNGFWGRISTSVENVKSNIKLCESIETPKVAINATNFPAQDNSDAAQNIYGFDFGAAGVTPYPLFVDVTATEKPVPSIYEAYIGHAGTGTGFPVNDADQDLADSYTAPASMEEAFDQSAWKYGKIGCEQKITRLADIELCLGYQWYCGDCASTNWYVGLVIPTGNKQCATYLAAPVVGNGQHVGIMAGSCFELLLSNSDSYTAWYRVDMNGRYLFKNTQKRSFDLLGNEWSRYMMVWENEAAYSAAVTDVNANNESATSYRNYTPGINVFTADMYVKPRTQARINSAVNFRSECFRAELGWNFMARQQECVQFACSWDQAPAFADSSYRGGMNLNNGRTIYNDSQLTSINAIDNFERINTAGDAVYTLAAEELAATDFGSFAISEDDVNLDSAAAPAAVIYTPYLTLGYAWDSECKPSLSVGAQYEFTAGNDALNHWMVWGKFDIAF